jgi:hypothetical protein
LQSTPQIIKASSEKKKNNKSGKENMRKKANIQIVTSSDEKNMNQDGL